MRIHTYLTLHKNGRSKRNLIWSAVLAFLLWTSHALFADIATLERIIEAEQKVGYFGIRLRTSVSSRGTRTFEEYVVHKPDGAAYRKVISVVGGHRSLGDQQRSGENRRDTRRRNRDDNDRDDRRRERERDDWRQVRSLFSQKEIKLIGQNYNLEQTSVDEVIDDHETDLLIITPKFAGRPTKHIFFARENGIILRVEDLDAEGVLREMFIYTKISFDPETVERKWKSLEKEDLKPQPRRSRAASLTDGEKILKTKPIQPEYLPPGFQLQDIRSIKRGRENDLIFFEYTDGLVNFTLFEEASNSSNRDREREGTKIEIAGIAVYKHQFGPTDAFRWSVGKIRFFLVGAIPTNEMEKVAESIIHKAKEK